MASLSWRYLTWRHGGGGIIGDQTPPAQARQAAGDDTDCGYYDTPGGNIWCPDDEPSAG